MRDRYVLKTEIDEAQQDLEHNLRALKEVIVEKVDLKARLDQKLADAKAHAMDYAVAGRELGLDLIDRARRLWRDQPLVVIGAVGGLLVVAGLVLTIRHELHEADAPPAAVTAARG